MDRRRHQLAHLRTQPGDHDTMGFLYCGAGGVWPRDQLSGIDFDHAGGWAC